MHSNVRYVSNCSLRILYLGPPKCKLGIESPAWKARHRPTNQRRRWVCSAGRPAGCCRPIHDDNASSCMILAKLHETESLSRSENICPRGKHTIQSSCNACRPVTLIRRQSAVGPLSLSLPLSPYPSLPSSPLSLGSTGRHMASVGRSVGRSVSAASERRGEGKGPAGMTLKTERGRRERGREAQKGKKDSDTG